MATAPIPAGGIVSVPDPVTGGAGAPTIVSQIVNANWANGITLLNKAFALGDKAIAVADTPPQMPVTTMDTSYLPPGLPTITPPDPGRAKSIYDDARLEIQALTEGGYVSFLETYFPVEPFWPAALSWIERALTTGGTGVRASVEAQLWERARSRMSIEADRATAEAMQAFANRGFPLPPGALVNQIQLIDQDRLNKLAEQSRDISIEAFRAELENVRLALNQAIDLRLKAIAAAGDYVRLLLQGPSVAMQLATATANIEGDFARTLVSFYTAQTAAADPRIRLSIANAQLQSQGNEANLRAKTTTIDARARLAQASAQMVATAAAASLNGINAGASISGSDSSSL